MNVSSRSLLLVAVCLMAAVIVACDKNDAAPSANPSPSPAPAPAPAPSPAPTPGPSPTTFTITGTVTETAPTTDRGVGGVSVSTEGASATTDSAGQFTLTLPAGAYILRASRGGYSDEVTTFTLPADAARVFNFQLAPQLDRQTRERSGTISGDSPICHGGSDPCQRFDFPSHHEDDVEITLLWESSDATLKLEFRCGGEVVDSKTERSENISRSGNEWLAIEMMTKSRKGQMCEARALHLSGPAQQYQIVMSHPN